MRIVYDDYKTVLDEKTGFGKNIVESIVDNITKQAVNYCQKRQKYYKEKYNIDIIINFDDLRTLQAVFDALTDLMRLKDFHPITWPNRIKCAAYLSYWWLQRQPIMFSLPDDCDYKTIFSGEKGREDLSLLINANAHWLISYMMCEIFEREDTPCAENENYQKQWEIELDYLFYFLCYRANSPKSIEALLTTAVLHPIWKVKKGVYFEQ